MYYSLFAGNLLLKKTKKKMHFAHDERISMALAYIYIFSRRRGRCSRTWLLSNRCLYGDAVLTQTCKTGEWSGGARAAEETNAVSAHTPISSIGANTWTNLSAACLDVFSAVFLRQKRNTEVQRTDKPGRMQGLLDTMLPFQLIPVVSCLLC